MDKQPQETNLTQTDYKKMAEERKLKAINEVWEKVEENDELQNIVRLRERLEKNKKMRQDTTNIIKEVKTQFRGVKENIKGFLNEQNQTANKLTYPKQKKKQSLQNH